MQVEVKLKKVPQIKTNPARAIKAAGLRYLEMVHEYINAKKAFTPRTGHLQRSIQIRFEPLKAIISANAEYAAYVEFGTKPHMILPKNRRALKIPKQQGFIFVKKVMHPGSKPYPYFFAEFEKRKDEVKKVFMAELLGSET